jgi:hypothetical protein
MAERKDEMGAVTHQLSAVDDDMHKSGNVKEANVASVALGMHNVMECKHRLVTTMLTSCSRRS